MLISGLDSSIEALPATSCWHIGLVTVTYIQQNLRLVVSLESLGSATEHHLKRVELNKLDGQKEVMTDLRSSLSATGLLISLVRNTPTRQQERKPASWGCTIWGPSMPVLGISYRHQQCDQQGARYLGLLNADAKHQLSLSQAL
eukprot:454953-Pelagomonas_calceolata.AAC.1